MCHSSNVAKQRFDEHIPMATNTHTTIVGVGVLYGVHIISNTQCVVKGGEKKAISSYQNFLFLFECKDGEIAHLSKTLPLLFVFA
jgi:hypothetical protein